MPDDQGPGDHAGPAAAPEPAKLPGNAPTALGDFVACTTDSVDVDLADVGWLPKPEAAPDFLTPSASVEDGWTPQRATIKIGYGDFLSISVPASIVDGELSVDTSNLGFGIGDEVTKWVDDFNATLAAHDKQLDRLDVRGGNLVLTKRAVVAATDAGAVTAAAAGSATGVGATPEDPPADGGPSKPPGGCLPWIAGALAAIALAIGIGVVATSGGDSDEQGDPPRDTAVVTDAPASDPPATDPPTTDPPATDPPTTDPPTTEQVGAAPADPSSVLPFCADFDALGDQSHGDLDGYMLIGGNCASVDDGAYLPRNCDPEVLPWCASGPDPAFGATGTRPGWVHQPSQADLFTGVEGPSYATMDFYMRSWNPDDTGDAFFTSDCGGQQLSGAAVVGPDGMVTAEHPLLSFGPCQVIDLAVAINIESQNPGLIVIPPFSLANGGFFEVGPDEPAAAPFDPGPYPQIVGPDAVPPGWAHSVQTIDNVLGGGGPLGDGCSIIVETQAIHGANAVFLDDPTDRCSARFWVFAAGRQPDDIEIADTVIAHNAAFVNPIGDIRPAIADTIEFQTSDPLFDSTDPAREPIFPCGPGHIAHGICVPDAPPVDAGSLVSVGVATGDSIPLEWDGTPRSYSVEFDHVAATALLEEAGWTLQTDEPRTRALLRDDSITFVFPQDSIDPGQTGPDGEQIEYVLRSMVDGVTVDQPAVPVVGLITTPAVLPEQPDGAAVESPDSGDDVNDDTDGNSEAPTESLDDFYAQLSSSLASGDLSFSLERLDPLVYEAYPTECPAALEGFADPDFVATLISDDGPSAWIWELPDGRTYDVPDAIAATVTVGGRGQSGSETQAHVQLHDGRYHWFTYCVP